MNTKLNLNQAKRIDKLAARQHRLGMAFSRRAEGWVTSEDWDMYDKLIAKRNYHWKRADGFQSAVNSLLA